MTPPPTNPVELTLKLLQSQASGFSRVVAKLLQINEGGQGLAHTKVVQDSLTTWFPRAAVSRSGAELSETSFLELVENIFVYYGFSTLGQFVFKPLFHKLSPTAFDKSLLSLPLSKVLQQKPGVINAVLPVKAAMILSSFAGAGIAGEYALSFVKNLMTQKVYRKSSFSDVINLSHNPSQPGTDEAVTRKAVTRIKQCLAVTVGLLGLSVALVRLGPKSITPQLKKFISATDFSFDSKGRMSLSRFVMMAFMGVAFVSYLDAARDRLERLEVMTRLAVVLPFLSFGSELIQKPIAKMIGKTCPQVLHPDGAVKTIQEIAQEALNATKGDPQSAVKRVAPLLSAKGKIFLMPLAISILIPGIGVSLLNRFWTAKRFKNAQPQQMPSLEPSMNLAPSPPFTVANSPRTWQASPTPYFSQNPYGYHVSSMGRFQPTSYPYTPTGMRV